MAKDGYRDTEEEYKDYSTKQLKRYASQSNSWGKRIAQADGLTEYFFVTCLGITVFGSLITAFLYAFIGSWVVLLVAGILLIIPCLTILILGMNILMGAFSAKAEYNALMNEIERREKKSSSE